MNVILIIISFLFLFYFLVSYFKKQKKELLYKKLNATYDKLEYLYIKDKTHLDNNDIKFLKLFKNISVNPEFLDIQILLLSKRTLEKQDKNTESKSLWFRNIIENQNDDFKETLYEFNKVSDKLITISFYNSEFVFYILKCLGVLLFHYGIFKFNKGTNKLKSDIKFSYNNEHILASALAN